VSDLIDLVLAAGRHAPNNGFDCAPRYGAAREFI
jgi:hypothetical protein